MEVKFISKYLSIDRFNSVNLPSFSVLTGVNGAGKTHLIEAIKNGSVQLDNFNKSEIVYYNYNTFSISNVYNGNKNEEWNVERNERFNQFNIQRQVIYLDIQSGLDWKIRLSYDVFAKLGFNIKNWHNREIDISLFKEFKNIIDKRRAIQDYLNKSNSSAFFQAISEYIEAKDINEIDINDIYLRFTEISDKFELEFANRFSADYRYLKSWINKPLISFSTNDFEPPYFSLSELLNDEKAYQFRRAQNDYYRVDAEGWNGGRSFLSHDDFIGMYGISPVDQINAVLETYDCNGYRLEVDFHPLLGIPREQMQLNIRLYQPNQEFSTNFDQLSSGEKTLIALTYLLFKTQRNKVVPKVLLLDEIDSALHPSMINRLVGVIREKFVMEYGLKVILVTHSPTTVALSPDESIFVVSKFGEERIQKQTKDVAIKILTEGFASLNLESADLGIQYNISKTDLPILFTEGITDKIVIETAWKKLFPNKEMSLYVQDCFDAGFLAQLLHRGGEGEDSMFKIYSNRVMIGLFDFDEKGFNSWNGLSKKHYQNLSLDPMQGFCKKNIGHKVYAMLLPVPENDIIKKQVIKNNNETYNNKSILTIELLFYGVTELQSYFKTESIAGGGQIVCFHGDKKAFANKIISLPEAAFRNFLPLFNSLNKIIETSLQST